MNSLKLKSKIKLYLSRFETLVRISTISGEYDINKHSENVLIPLLEKVYGWELKNANISEKNTKAVDLIDTTRKIAIQVSADNRIGKIKDTIDKFVTSKYKKDVKTLYFYFLIPKQKKYSSDTIWKITKGKLTFGVKNNIMDAADVYQAVESITDIDRLKDIEIFLAKEFSDFKMSDEVTFSQYENFKKKYKDSCLNNYTRLNFFGLSIPSKPREVKLYSLFVKPEFSRRIISDKIFTFKSTKYVRAKNKVIPVSDVLENIQGKQGGSHSQKIIKSKGFSHKLKFAELFDFSNHIVLLGNPGAGKSSLIKYSICKIVEGDYEVFSEKEIYSYLPYRIELHKYNQFKKATKGGFFEFIHRNIIEEFQVEIESKKLFQIIEIFPAILFFDGLDEIFDIQERLQIRNDIENFVRQRPKIKSIVTSRYESYEEVKLGEDLYLTLSVDDFDDNQIKEYVEKWYSIEEANEFVKRQETKDCIEQLKAVDNQLKHNPLLLSLILILYRNEKDLPTSKLDIYEGCAQTLIEHRDKKEKKLDLGLRVSHKVSIFSNLAYWQFSNEAAKKEIKIDHFVILNFIANYLVGKGEFEDRNEAEEAAKQFLEYAKLRSIYFENKFTHKTFYEYFTANYIFSNYYSTPGQYEFFLKLVEQNIGLSSWAVILELLICSIDKGQLEYKVIDSIADHLVQIKPYETCNLFLTVMPHLRTLSPAKTKEILIKVIEYIFKGYPSKKDGDEENRFGLLEKFSNLLQTNKFKEIVIGILDRELELKEEKGEKYYQFLFELNVLNKGLSEIINKHAGLRKDDERSFIIVNIKDIYDEAKVIVVLTKFIKRFGIESVFKVYYSDFKLRIFESKTFFIWVSVLFSNPKVDKEKVWGIFKKHGIGKKEVMDRVNELVLIDERSGIQYIFQVKS